MEWLNYHHLLYFWVVAREGGLAPAARVLRLAPPTVSAQIHALEDSLGERLFVKHGRRLTLTPIGRTVLSYADQIFSLGRELVDTVRDRPTGKPLRLVVGISDVIPKLIALRLLQPALRLAEPVRVVCREDKPERLLVELSTHELDVVLSDAALPTGSSVRAFSHLLGECAVGFFAAAALRPTLTASFPALLDGAPLLLPTEHSGLRRTLAAWLDREGLRPRVVGEFDDSALMKAFGEAGVGIFPAPLVIRDELERHYGASLVGQVDTIKARFYAITVERKLKHPAVVAISTAAREARDWTSP